MGRTVDFTDEAKADLRAIDQRRALQILRTLGRFAKTGVGDVKIVEGIEPAVFRLRAQDYRVFFEYLDENDIRVNAVRHRREAYR